MSPNVLCRRTGSSRLSCASPHVATSRRLRGGGGFSVVFGGVSGSVVGSGVGEGVTVGGVSETGGVGSVATPLTSLE